MKKLFVLIGLLFAIHSALADRYTLSFTVTNAPVALTNGSYYVNGQARTWTTNAISSSTAKITNSVSQAATNMLTQALTGGFTGGPWIYSVATNTFKVTGGDGVALTGAITGSWGYVSIQTNPSTGSGHALIVPPESQPANVGTTDGNAIIRYINLGTATINSSRAPGTGGGISRTNSTLAGTTTNTGTISGGTITGATLTNTTVVGDFAPTNGLLAVSGGNLTVSTASGIFTIGLTSNQIIGATVALGALTNGATGMLGNGGTLISSASTGTFANVSATNQVEGLAATLAAGNETGTKTQIFGAADGSVRGVFRVANGLDNLMQFAYSAGDDGVFNIGQADGSFIEQFRVRSDAFYLDSSGGGNGHLFANFFDGSGYFLSELPPQVTLHALNAANGAITAATVTASGTINAGTVTGDGSGLTNTQTAAALVNDVLDVASWHSLYTVTLTNHTSLVFTNHLAGRVFWLQLKQDSTGGWTNAWDGGILWPSNSVVGVTTNANYWDMFKFVDDGTYWLAEVNGLAYSINVVAGGGGSTALLFDGAQNEVVVPNNAGLFPSTALTIEFWFKLANGDTGTGSKRIALISYDTGGYIFVPANYSDGNSAFYVQTAGDLYGVSMPVAANLNDGNWHHFAGVFNSSGNTLRLFYDGVLTNETATTLLAIGGTADLEIGQGLGLSSTFDEVRISSVARYTTDFTPDTCLAADADTVAYWKFNEGSGTTAADQTSNYDGTLTGSPVADWVAGECAP